MLSALPCPSLRRWATRRTCGTSGRSACRTGRTLVSRAGNEQMHFGGGRHSACSTARQGRCILPACQLIQPCALPAAAKREGLLFLETSALDGSNVEEAFTRVATEVGTRWAGGTGWRGLVGSPEPTQQTGAVSAVLGYSIPQPQVLPACSPHPSPLRSTALCASGGWSRSRGTRSRRRYRAASASPSSRPRNRYPVFVGWKPVGSGKL